MKTLTAQTGLALPLEIRERDGGRFAGVYESDGTCISTGLTTHRAAELARLVNAHTALVEALRDWQDVAALLADAIRHLDLKAPNEVNQINAVIAGQAALKQYETLKSTRQTQV